MTLPLEKDMKFGWMTSMDSLDSVRQTTKLADEIGMDSLWVGDHIAFAVPIMDPLLQLAQAAALSDRLTLGTSVFLLPLRHPTTVAKQVSTLDRLTEGRLIFGVGIGGEFPNEFAACGVPVKERGARLSEGMDVLRKLWTGDKVSNDGKFFPFNDVQMRPKPIQAGGPPIWCGGRSEPALKRAGQKADGYISYVVTPDMYKAALDTMSAAADEAKREVDSFGTAHLLFFRIDDTFEKSWDVATEHLSERYASDFRNPAKRYCALGKPEDVAATINQFREAGVRHIIVDSVSPLNERHEQVERFAKEVKPLLVS
ncbi:MAG: TIGR03619 family F420-dependent LLM class oxidoreductase [Porticoccaceae bacterium]|nr:TIGR03619 family F420-dependent LLM class oxidoreductase [Porticoccaceae bacterium]